MSIIDSNSNISGFASRSWETAKDYSRAFIRALPAIATIVAVPLILSTLPLAAAEESEQVNADQSGALSMVQDVAMTATGVFQTALMFGGLLGAAAHVNRQNRTGNEMACNFLANQNPLAEPFSFPECRELIDRCEARSEKSQEMPNVSKAKGSEKAAAEDLEPNEKKYLVVDSPGNKSGMFATFLYMLGVYDEFEKSPDKYSGLEINFGKQGVYYDEDRGENWWEYFFNPVKLGENEGDVRKHSKLERWNLANSVESNYTGSGSGMPRELGYAYFKKYFKVSPEIQSQVDAFADKHFTGKQVISIHYRGTDKVGDTEDFEAPRLTYEDMRKHVEDQLQGRDFEDVVLFVATDEQQFVEFMEKEFPGKVVTTNVKRSSDGKPLHLGVNDPYKAGQGALIDCLLLAHGDVLIRTSSNLSLFAKYINPTMNIVEVTQRTVMTALLKKMASAMQAEGIDPAFSVPA